MASEIDQAPELRVGAQGPEITPWVTYLQQLLAARGPRTYSGPIDGNFDATVEAAVKAVQHGINEYARTHNQPLIAEDGVASHPVWQDLYSGASNKEQLDAGVGVQAATHRVASDEDSGDDGVRVEWSEVARTGQKLGPGREIGRAGWVHGSLQCSVVDFKDDPYHGPVYVVFQDVHNTQSDEGGHADNGWCTIANIWLPIEGHLRVTLESHAGPLHGVIHDQFNLAQDPNLAVHVRQLHEEKTVTVAEAQQHGWMNGWTVNEGVDFKVTVGPASVGVQHQHSDQHQDSGSDTRTLTETVTVRLATPNLEILRTG